jgi:hypothetical protein
MSLRGRLVIEPAEILAFYPTLAPHSRKSIGTMCVCCSAGEQSSRDTRLDVIGNKNCIAQSRKGKLDKLGVLGGFA